MSDYKITVTAKGPTDSEFASSMVVYIPTKLRRDANLNPGDKFEVKVSDNKCAIRQSDDGESAINASGYISVPASRFKPPLIVHPTVQLQHVFKGEWLLFKVPEDFEYVAKGFDLVEESAPTKGFSNV